MRKASWLGAALAAFLVLHGSAEAAIRLHGLFADDMVLQQGMPVPIWGQAEPGETITVEFGTQAARAEVDKDGAWKLNLLNLKAGGPYELKVKGTKSEPVTLKNVLVGEVWICSGQSNMEWSMTATRDAQKNIAAAKHPNIRLFYVPKAPAAQPQKSLGDTRKAQQTAAQKVFRDKDGNPVWHECAPENVASFSAVAYYFGRKLHQERKVPIGLIQTAWGGTAAERWTSAEVLKTKFGLTGLKGSDLYNGMIAPLVPFAFRGAIWYQGESNVGRAWQYRFLFPAMIRNWREDWNQGDFPFLFVQIAPYDYGNKDHCAVLREAQLHTAQTVENTAMAVINDYGNNGDIHPIDKDPVGTRLALAALALAYKEDVPYTGPLYDGHKVEGSKIVLSFKNAAKGLEARGLEIPTTVRVFKGKKVVGRKEEPIKVPAGKLVGFTIAGKDGKFVEAEAEIQGNTVVLSSAQVQAPVAVRYGWSDMPVLNLFDGTGLPATPFRTDNFPVPTQPTKQ